MTAAAAAAMLLYCIVFSSHNVLSSASCRRSTRKWAEWVGLDACWWRDDERSLRVNEQAGVVCVRSALPTEQQRHLAERSGAERGALQCRQPVGADKIRSRLHVIKTTMSMSGIRTFPLDILHPRISPLLVTTILERSKPANDINL